MDDRGEVTRRRWIAGVTGAVIAGAAVDALLVEPRRLTITRHRVGSAAGTTMRIAQLSDLHLKSVGEHEERIAAAVERLRPDLILITGDTIDRARYLKLVESFLSLLPSTPRKLAIPGNWDHWAVDIRQLARIYERKNCQLLRNESVVLPFGGTELLVTGLDDFVGGRPDPRAALGRVTPRSNHLLLAHCPKHRDVFRSGLSAEIDERLLTPQLMLSGHTHGGQITLFGWALITPPGSGRYVHGWYRDDAIPLYVSRGLGTSGIPARFYAPPEIAFFEWGLVES